MNGRVIWKTWRPGVGKFSENLGPVLIGDKWGFANRSGEIVIEPRWKNLGQGYFYPPAGPFSEGLAAVVENVRWDVIEDSNYYTYECGYINTKGKYLSPPKFRQSCGQFRDGLARIEVDLQGSEYEKGQGWIGFLNKQGDWAIKPQFFAASDFKDGFALVQSEPNPQDLYIKIPGTGLVRDNLKRQSLYLIDKTGRQAAGKQDCLWRYPFSEGLAETYNENGQIEFINERCETVFRLATEIQIAGSFSSGLLAVSKTVAGRKLFGYVDRTGKMAIPFQFADAESFSDGLAGVVMKDHDKSTNAYINPKGEVVLKNKVLAPFDNGLSFHLLKLITISESRTHRNIYGYMNKQGKYVWLSPGAETALDKNWIRENYLGSPVH